MPVEVWFWLISSLGLTFSFLLLLDGAHRAHIGELKRGHNAELAGMRTYIRTLNRERKWLEAELGKYKAKLDAQQDAARAGVPWMPEHIFLPPSEEYDSGEE